jgi:hypothetical protein
MLDLLTRALCGVIASFQPWNNDHGRDTAFSCVSYGSRTVPEARFLRAVVRIRISAERKHLVSLDTKITGK